MLNLTRRRTAAAVLASVALVSTAAAIAPADAAQPTAHQPGPKPALVEPDSAFQGVPDLTTSATSTPATYPQVAAKPYMGWSSWSLQSTNYPGVNPDGPGSFISEQNILTQAQAMATKLKPFLDTA